MFWRWTWAKLLDCKSDGWLPTAMKVRAACNLLLWWSYCVSIDRHVQDFLQHLSMNFLGGRCHLSGKMNEKTKLQGKSVHVHDVAPILHQVMAHAWKWKHLSMRPNHSTHLPLPIDTIEIWSSSLLGLTSHYLTHTSIWHDPCQATSNIHIMQYSNLQRINVLTFTDRLDWLTGNICSTDTQIQQGWD